MVTGILITGGKSSRMGSDKAFVNYNGKALGQWSSELLNKYCDHIIVASNNPDHANWGDEIVADTLGDGPIAGLYAGLSKSNTVWNLVLPCDTPNVSEAVIEKLLESKDGYDAVVAVDANGKQHPLVALYHRQVLEVISGEIEKGKLAMMNILDQIQVGFVQFSQEHVLDNINSKQELR